MSLTAAERLEQARRACQEIGVGMDDLNALAVRYSTVARLLSISVRKVQKLVAGGELAVVEIGGPRIELVELVDFMDRHRVRRGPGHDDSMRARARALLEESIEVG